MNLPPNLQAKHVPAKLAAALITASRVRRNTYIDMLNKLQRSMSDMQSECQTLAIFSRMDPTVVNALTLGQNSTLLAVAAIVQSLQQAEQAELIVQGEVQRWLAGFPPSLPGHPPAPPPPPPQPPKAVGPEPAPIVQHPVQMTPIAQAPAAVQMFESPAEAKQAAETQAVAIQQGQLAPVQTVPNAAPVVTQANGTPNPSPS